MDKIKCNGCRSEFDPDVLGSAKVVVHPVEIVTDDKARKEFVERSRYTLHLCPNCYKEADIDGWLMDGDEMKPEIIAVHRDWN